LRQWLLVVEIILINILIGYNKSKRYSRAEKNFYTNFPVLPSNVYSLQISNIPFDHGSERRYYTNPDCMIFLIYIKGASRFPHFLRSPSYNSITKIVDMRLTLYRTLYLEMFKSHDEKFHIIKSSLEPQPLVRYEFHSLSTFDFMITIIFMYR